MTPLRRPGRLSRGGDPALRRGASVRRTAGTGYLYQTGSVQLDVICERVESVYEHKPVTLIRAILDAPDEKLRLFAQAFQLSGKAE